MARDYSRKPENVTTTDAVDENNHSFVLAKKKEGGRRGGGSGNESWSSADHFERQENQLARQDKRIRNENTSNSNKPT